MIFVFRISPGRIVPFGFPALVPECPCDPMPICTEVVLPLPSSLATWLSSIDLRDVKNRQHCDSSGSCNVYWVAPGM